MEQNQPCHSELATLIDSCLPQTQCTLCGYPRCKDYAVALANNQTDINRCSPGGNTTISALAELLNTTTKDLAKDVEPHLGRKQALIRESECIGCTLCINPCPVDAIVGASGMMHTVVQSHCTGCGLCVEFCPVDCIEMIDIQLTKFDGLWSEYSEQEVDLWRKLADRHHYRFNRTDTPIAFAFTNIDFKLQIREAVNRERARRWKKQNRSAKISKS